MSSGLRVIHLADRYIVIDKPEGLLSVPGKGPDKQDCVPARLRALLPRARGPLVVHRLDMDTSGLLVLGLDDDAQRDLSNQFQERTVEKVYIAVVLGHVPAERGEINAPIRPDLLHRPLQVIDHADGKPSVTRWSLLAYEPERSRLKLDPATGRTHQLRVHLAHIGHAIAGDVLYGPQPETANASSRLLLHASMMEFREPGGGPRVRFELPAPF